MLQRFSIAFGAGSAAALLFVVSAEPSFLAVALANLAPLPIMIAALGWGAGAGAVAGLVATLALAAIVNPLSAALFAISVALPAWALSAFAITPIERYRRAGGGAVASHFPGLGAVLTAAACFGAAASAAALGALMIKFGGYGEVARQIAGEFEAVIKEALDAAPGSGEFKPVELARVVAHLAPAASAAWTTLALGVNLYAAGRSVQLSGRLPRPWVDLPGGFMLSWPLGVLFLASLGAAMYVPSPYDQFVWICAGALGAAHTLQGLAVAHELSRGLPMRPAMLIALYLCCLLRAKWTLPVVAAIGVVESFLRLRARVAAHLPTKRT